MVLLHCGGPLHSPKGECRDWAGTSLAAESQTEGCGLFMCRVLMVLEVILVFLGVVLVVLEVILVVLKV